MSRVILIGCGSSKQDVITRARDLYTGNLTRARIQYAEATGCDWFILSASHWLVHPDKRLRPYNVTLTKTSEREAWTRITLMDLRRKYELGRMRFEIHAGAAYRDGLAQALRQSGALVDEPTASLGIGEQLAFYKQQREGVAA